MFNHADVDAGADVCTLCTHNIKIPRKQAMSAQTLPAWMHFAWKSRVRSSTNRMLLSEPSTCQELANSLWSFALLKVHNEVRDRLQKTIRKAWSRHSWGCETVWNSCVSIETCWACFEQTWYTHVATNFKPVTTSPGQLQNTHRSYFADVVHHQKHSAWRSSKQQYVEHTSQHHIVHMQDKKVC